MNKMIDPGQLMGFRIERVALAQMGARSSQTLGVKTGEKMGDKSTVRMDAVKTGMKSGEKQT